MKNDILQLIHQNPRAYNKKIFNNPSMKDWIEKNCDTASPDFNTKVYTALYNIDLLCPCGSGKLRKVYKNKLCCCGISCTERIKKIQQTSLIRYNAKCPLQNKDIQEKTKQTNIARYGTENPQQNKDIQEKTKQTNIARYGVICSLTNPKISEKTKQTNIARYGTENPQQNKDIQEKTKQTNIARYGTENPAQNHFIKQKIKKNLNAFYEKNNIINGSQANWNDVTKQTMFDQHLFKKELQLLGVPNFSRKYNISFSSIYKYHKKYKLHIIKSMSSLYEDMIKQWLDSKDIAYESNSRNIISPHELDIYIPSYNLAIEFNGLYWHSEPNKNKWYHYNKTKACREKGIMLIHIFEDEWNFRKDICLDLISRFLHLTEKNLMARKCQLKEISNKEAKEFLIKNHLQGFAVSSVNIGLFFDNMLVQLMTFKSPRYNKNIDWEIIRSCSHFNISVIGGFQKIWSYFVKKYQPKSVVSYCDRRWFRGKIYENLGFIKKQKTKPTYWYTDMTNRFHRSRFTKQKAISESLKICNLPKITLDSYTENQITRDILCLNRIWDCGQESWFWKK